LYAYPTTTTTIIISHYCPPKQKQRICLCGLDKHICENTRRISRTRLSRSISRLWHCYRYDSDNVFLLSACYFFINYNRCRPRAFKTIIVLRQWTRARDPRYVAFVVISAIGKRDSGRTRESGKAYRGSSNNNNNNNNNNDD